MSPPVVRRKAARSPALEDLLAAFCACGPWSSLDAWVERGRRAWRARAGCAAACVPTDLRHDLASLTKPFVATLALALERKGVLPLGARVGDLFPEASPKMARVRLASLLRHRSGLVPWTPLAERVNGRREALALLLSGRLTTAPAAVYSDLGPILGGVAAERATGRPRGDLLRRFVLAPLNLVQVEWAPRDRASIAPCPLDNSRERELAAAQGIELPARAAPRRGTVQDGNARFLSRGGGLAGHAGLFGDAPSVAALAREWVRPGRILTPALVEEALAGSGPYALGWARRRVRGSAGRAFGPAAFGHTGFTGGSVWADRESGSIAVLLGHRRSFAELNPWRREFHLVARALVAAGDGSASGAR